MKFSFSGSFGASFVAVALTDDGAMSPTDVFCVAMATALILVAIARVLEWEVTL